MTLPIDFDAHPLIPAVIQDDVSRDVLMVGFMNRLAFVKTQETGFVHFWSRSRGKLWKKGETSGHTQEVVSIAVNCEDNSLLIQVLQNGAVCHTGHTTCFFRQVLPDGTLFETSDPVFDPTEVYETRRDRVDEDHVASIQRWFGAYEYLRDHPLQDVSGTSKLMHQVAMPFDRVADELDELVATFQGTHSHSGDLKQDVVLEGSQVFYWLNVIAVGTRLSWDTDLAIGDAIALHSEPGNVPPDINIGLVRSMANSWRNTTSEPTDVEASRESLACELARTYLLVARAVEPVIDPVELIRSDLDALRAKPYLADYFASVDG